MAIAKSAKKSGGARKGSGRKTTGRGRVTLYISQEEKAWIKKQISKRRREAGEMSELEKLHAQLQNHSL